VTLARTQASFAFAVEAPRSRAFALFGAWGEKAWAGDDWQPCYLHPDPPRDEAYAVFTVAHGPHEAVWVNTAFDLAAGRVQYVYVVPGVQAVVIDLALAEEDARRTRVAVTYRRTALDPAMNERVREMAAHDRENGPEWERLIAAASARR